MGALDRLRALLAESPGTDVHIGIAVAHEIAREIGALWWNRGIPAGGRTWFGAVLGANVYVLADLPPDAVIVCRG